MQFNATSITRVMEHYIFTPFSEAAKPVSLRPLSQKEREWSVELSEKEKRRKNFVRQAKYLNKFKVDMSKLPRVLFQTYQMPK